MTPTLAALLVHLAELAFTDDLTGLANRRRFHAELSRNVALARRTGRPLAVLMLDVDGLKRVNDTRGHHEGDRLICDTGSLVRERLRASDLVARLAGDEFAALLPDTELDEARALAERLSDELGAALATTVSVGAAALAGDGDPLIEADRMMYEAKRAKRTLTCR